MRGGMSILLAGLLVIECVRSAEVSLNYPTVLLPYNEPDVPINFTVSVSSGCAFWSSSRPAAVSLRATTTAAAAAAAAGEEGGGKACVESVSVSATHKDRSRVFSVVQADLKHGAPLVCDVEVNVISRISIVTSTKILYIGFPFTIFSVAAFDDNENTFSTLEGIAFNWEVLPDPHSKFPDHTGTNVVKIPKWSEIANQPPAAITELEKQGKRGSMVVISGHKIGVAHIKTSISNKVYPAVPPSSVRVIVKDYLILLPSGFVCIVVQQALPFVTLNMNYNRRLPIQLPTDTYWLSLSREDHLKLYPESSTVQGLSTGETAVCISSTIPDDDTGPCVDVLVSEPHLLQFSTLPDHDWMLEVGLRYQVFVKVLDKMDNVIYPDSLNIHLKTDGDFVSVLHQSQNGSHFVMEPTKIGTSELFGQLVSVVGYQNVKVELTGDHRVSSTQKFEIIEPVRVVPKKLGFMWIPESSNRYSYQLTATGGSGSYKWQSDNLRVCEVSRSGVVETVGNSGSCAITVTDRTMSRHSDVSEVSVGPPVRVIPSPYRVEVKSGDLLHLPVRVFSSDADGVLYEVADCHSAPFELSFMTPGILEFVSIDRKSADLEYSGESCAVIALRGLKSGFSEVRVDLLSVTNSTTVGVYPPLAILEHEGRVVLSVGSSLNLVTEGGVLPWVLDSSQFYSSAQPEHQSVLRHMPNHLQLPRRHSSGVFTVQCVDIGESSVSFLTGNKPSATNRHPMTEEAVIAVTCAAPASLLISPDPHIPGCPPYSNPQSDSIPVAVNQAQKFNVIARDKSGRVFTNFSSLNFQVSPVDSSYVVVDTLKFPQISLRISETGYHSVTVTLSGFKPGVEKQPPYADVSGTINVEAVSEPSLEASQVSVFNHPSNKRVVRIDGGSRYFQLTSSFSGQKVSHTVLDQGSVLIAPVSDGNELLYVRDVCLPSSAQLSLEVVVSSIGTIAVRTKRLLQLNSTDELEVTVTDSHGSVIEASMFPFINLSINTNNDVVKFDPLPEEHFQKSRRYRTTARQIGTSSVFFSAKLSSGDIMSPMVDIQVFSPLAVQPSVVYLLVGQLYQILTSGGPQPMSHLSFAEGNRTVGVVSNSGLFEASCVGSTVVTVSVLDHADKTVFSKASVAFHVVTLKSIEIALSLSHAPTGSILPVYVTGNSGALTPLTANIGLLFDWEVGNGEVVSLWSQHEASGVSQKSEANFATRLITLSPGRASVKVRVSSTDERLITAGAHLVAEATVFVYESLALVAPSAETSSSLLMTPRSSILLRTSRNFANFNVVHQHPAGLVSIDHRGLVTSRDQLGKAVLVVECTEDNGENQTLAVLVQVKLTSYLRVQTLTQFTSAAESAVPVIPQGMSVALGVTFHDGTGQTFHSSNADIKFRLNRYDVGQVSHGSDNSSLIFRNSKSGNSVLKVWDRVSSGSGELSTYLNLPVGNVIRHSSREVVVGDLVCFHAPLDLVERTWVSSSGDILAVDGTSGVGVAMQPGAVDVTLKCGKEATFTSVDVLPVSSLLLSSEGGTQYVYSSDDHREFIFRVSTQGQKSYSCGKEVGFSKLDDSWFKCAAWFDSAAMAALSSHLVVSKDFSWQSGYFCRLSLTQPTALQQEALSTLVSKVNVQAVVQPLGARETLPSNVIQLDFAPRFFLSSKSVILSNHYPSAEVVLNANPQVLQKLKVAPRAANLVTVTELRGENSTRIVIKMKPSALEVADSENSFVDVTCGISMHHQSISVAIKKLRYEGMEDLTSNIWNNFFFYIAIAMTLLCMLFGYYIMLVYKQQNRLIDLSISEAAASHSPYRSGGGSGGGGGSPPYRTQQNLLNRTGSPGETPFPGGFSHMRRRHAALNSWSLVNSLDDSMTVPSSPCWSSKASPPPRITLWSQGTSPAGASGGGDVGQGS